MGFLSALTKGFTSTVKEITNDYSHNDVFLKAVCASAALVGYADGTLEDGEKKAATDVITGHKALATYTRDVVDRTLSSAFDHAKSHTGKQSLIRDIEAVKGQANASEMADDVYLVALDVTGGNSHGGLGPDEKRVMDGIAKRLGVDPSKFDI